MNVNESILLERLAALGDGAIALELPSVGPEESAAWLLCHEEECRILVLHYFGAALLRAINVVLAEGPPAENPTDLQWFEIHPEAWLLRRARAVCAGLVHAQWQKTLIEAAVDRLSATRR